MTRLIRQGPLAVPRQREGHGRRVRPGQPSVLTTKVALQLPTEMTYEDWARTGHQLAGVLTSSSWWLGDWLIYGKDHYHNRYDRAIQAAGLQYQTLRNYAWVAARFAPERRRDSLSFQHHAELASLSVKEQEHWLQRSQEHRWSLRQLRDALRESRGARSEPAPGTGMRQLALPHERFTRWGEAAAQAGTDLEQWVIATLDTAAEQILTA